MLHLQDQLVKIIKELERLAADLGAKGFVMASDEIAHVDELLACVAPNVKVFRFSPKWSLPEFMTKLEASLKDVPVDSLEFAGWIFHGMEGGFRILDTHLIDLTSKSNVTQWQHVIDTINLVATRIKPDPKYGKKRFDLIACCLLGNPLYEHVYKLLTLTTDVDLASSDDLTGNVYGADWILESHNVNLIGTYFREDTEDKLAGIPVQLSKDPFKDLAKKLGKAFVDGFKKVGMAAKDLERMVNKFSKDVVNKLSDDLGPAMVKGLYEVGADLNAVNSLVAEFGKDIVKNIGVDIVKLSKEGYNVYKQAAKHVQKSVSQIESEMVTLANTVANGVQDNLSTIETIAGYIAALDPTGTVGLAMAIGYMIEAAVEYDKANTKANMITLVVKCIDVGIALADVAISKIAPGTGTTTRRAAMRAMGEVLVPVASIFSGMGQAIAAYVADPSNANREALIHAANQSAFTAATA